MKRRPSLASLVAFLLAVSSVVYVLSYAPVANVYERSVIDPYNPLDIPVADGSLYPAYKPVDWLIDHTPLRSPLFLWAGLFDVREQFEFGLHLRETDAFEFYAPSTHDDPTVRTELGTDLPEADPDAPILHGYQSKEPPNSPYY